MVLTPDHLAHARTSSSWHAQREEAPEEAPLSEPRINEVTGVDASGTLYLRPADADFESRICLTRSWVSLISLNCL
jgi:hypothetical protein